jgi:HEAT repeat protein
VLLHDEEAPVRRAAAEALGKVAVPAVELLAASLEDHDREVRRAATEALDKVGLPADPATHARYAVTRRDWASASALGSAAVDAVLAAVDEEEVFMRQAAAQALAEIGTGAVEPLIAALAAGSAVAADALGQIGDARAVEPLLAALRGAPGLRVRQAAEGALARLLRQGGLDETTRQRILAARS